VTARPEWIKNTVEGATFAVRVSPRASRTGLVGLVGEGADAVLRIALNAPPIEGKANAALIVYLSDVLGVARSQVEVIAGSHSRNKLVRVRARSADEVAASFAQLLRSLVH